MVFKTGKMKPQPVIFHCWKNKKFRRFQVCKPILTQLKLILYFIFLIKLVQRVNFLALFFYQIIFKKYTL